MKFSFVRFFLGLVFCVFVNVQSSAYSVRCSLLDEYNSDPSFSNADCRVPKLGFVPFHFEYCKNDNGNSEFHLSMGDKDTTLISSVMGAVLLFKLKSYIFSILDSNNFKKSISLNEIFNESDTIFDIPSRRLYSVLKQGPNSGWIKFVLDDNFVGALTFSYYPDSNVSRMYVSKTTGIGYEDEHSGSIEQTIHCLHNDGTCCNISFEHRHNVS